MSKVTTEHIFDGQNISYEISNDGYDIFLGSRSIPWISQHEPDYIKYPELGYERACLKHIEEIMTTEEQDTELEPRVADLERTVGTMLGRDYAV